MPAHTDIRLHFIERGLQGVQRLNRRVVETVREVIKLGKYLRRLKRVLTPLEWKEFTHSEEFGLSNSTASKLMKIASCPRILNRANWPFLSQSRTALYEIYGLTDQQWLHGITTDRPRGDRDQHGNVEKIISPDSTVAELKALKRWSPEPPKPPGDEAHPPDDTPKGSDGNDSNKENANTGTTFDVVIHLEGRNLPADQRLEAERLIEIIEDSLAKLQLTLDTKFEVTDSVVVTV